jgi:predicted transposase YdaD
MPDGINQCFLKTHGSEVHNMLLDEWNQEDALRVREQEGMNKGRVEGRMEGRVEERHEVARNALAKGLPPAVISEITGLDARTISALAGR